MEPDVAKLLVAQITGNITPDDRQQINALVSSRTEQEPEDGGIPVSGRDEPVLSKINEEGDGLLSTFFDAVRRSKDQYIADMALGEARSVIEREEGALTGALDFLLGRQTTPAEDLIEISTEARRRVDEAPRNETADAVATLLADEESGQEFTGRLRTAFGMLLQDPVAFADFSGSSLVQSLPTMIGAIAATPAGPLSAAVAAGLGTFDTESKAAVAAYLGEEGIDITSATQLETALRDDKLLDRIQKRAAQRGIGVAAVDALVTFASAGLGRAALGKASPSRTRVAAVGAGEGAVEFTGEPLSEIGGQLAAGEGLNLGEAAVEALAAGPQSVFQGVGQAVAETARGARQGDPVVVGGQEADVTGVEADGDLAVRTREDGEQISVDPSDAVPLEEEATESDESQADSPPPSEPPVVPTAPEDARPIADTKDVFRSVFFSQGSPDQRKDMVGVKVRLGERDLTVKNVSQNRITLIDDGGNTISYGFAGFLERKPEIIQGKSSEEVQESRSLEEKQGEDFLLLERFQEGQGDLSGRRFSLSNGDIFEITGRTPKRIAFVDEEGKRRYGSVSGLKGRGFLLIDEETQANATEDIEEAGIQAESEEVEGVQEGQEAPVDTAIDEVQRLHYAGEVNAVLDRVKKGQTGPDEAARLASLTIDKTRLKGFAQGINDPSGDTIAGKKVTMSRGNKPRTYTILESGTNKNGDRGVRLETDQGRKAFMTLEQIDRAQGIRISDEFSNQAAQDFIDLFQDPAQELEQVEPTESPWRMYQKGDTDLNGRKIMMEDKDGDLKEFTIHQVLDDGRIVVTQTDNGARSPVPPEYLESKNAQLVPLPTESQSAAEIKQSVYESPLEIVGQDIVFRNRPVTVQSFDTRDGTYALFDPADGSVSKVTPEDLIAGRSRSADAEADLAGDRQPSGAAKAEHTPPIDGGNDQIIWKDGKAGITKEVIKILREEFGLDVKNQRQKRGWDRAIFLAIKNNLYTKRHSNALAVNAIEQNKSPEGAQPVRDSEYAGMAIRAATLVKNMRDIRREMRSTKKLTESERTEFVRRILVYEGELSVLTKGMDILGSEAGASLNIIQIGTLATEFTSPSIIREARTRANRTLTDAEIAELRSLVDQREEAVLDWKEAKAELEARALLELENAALEAFNTLKEDVVGLARRFRVSPERLASVFEREKTKVRIRLEKELNKNC